MASRRSLPPVLLLTAVLAPAPAVADDVVAGSVTDLSVTVYRAPEGHAAARELYRPDGFALVSETRTLSIPAGESRIRFQGVADEIDPSTAILTGLPTGLVEKNREGQVLSPTALLAATVGRDVELVRTDPKTGATTRVSGILDSDADGVVFKSAAGVEALRCSGLPETFDFEGAAAGAASSAGAATPTLSALVRSPKPLTVTVRLSYLARGFDWMANYVAVIAADGKTMDLGGWVTLANSNTVSFPSAHAQVVAGRVNRESDEVAPVDPGDAIVAKCWPRGSTSDTPNRRDIVRAEPLWDGRPYYSWERDADVIVTANRQRAPIYDTPTPMAAMALARLVKEEELGDLKLYRVPERTSVIRRQVKQVRLLDRHAVPVEFFYGAELQVGGDSGPLSLHEFLRARNDTAHHLGLPLPSGQVSAFVDRDNAPVLVNEVAFGDTAVNQDVELDLGEAADLELQVTNDCIDITNARRSPAAVEIALKLPDGERLVRPSVVPIIVRNGHPVLKATVPAGGDVSICYQTG
jgi:hypothetical protein